ncbi:MAG: DUF4062 domain-containing protein [Bacteroidota bacterium]
MQRKVYISSTYWDLKDYREAIMEMFQKVSLSSQYTLILMEGYVAESGLPPINVCLRDVGNADIYILIMGNKYGSVVQDTSKSYTEMEYDMAMKTFEERESGTYDIFAFYGQTDTGKNILDNLSELQNPELEAFYSKVRNVHATFGKPFTSPESLCLQILHSLIHRFTVFNDHVDYKRALLMMDRVGETSLFTTWKSENKNSFCFSSEEANSPHDFLKRICNMEMTAAYHKCDINLGQFTSISPDKFRIEFEGHLREEWPMGFNGDEFSEEEKLFLSIEVGALEIEEKNKMENLKATLLDFLPKFLIQDHPNCTNHIFFIFFSYQDIEKHSIDKFNVFIKNLELELNINGCLSNMNDLNDVMKIDVNRWLNKFLAQQEFDEDDLDQILEASVPDASSKRKFKMKEVNRSIKKWLQDNLKN